MFFNSISVPLSQNEAAETLVQMSNGPQAKAAQPSSGRQAKATQSSSGDQVHYGREKNMVHVMSPLQRSLLSARAGGNSHAAPQSYGSGAHNATNLLPSGFTGSIDTLAQQHRIMGINVQNMGYVTKRH